jgi:hypothetical protein
MTKESIWNTVGNSEGRVLGEKIVLKVKVKFTLEQATKAHRGSRGIALLFL